MGFHESHGYLGHFIAATRLVVEILLHQWHSSIHKMFVLLSFSICALVAGSYAYKM